MKENDADRVVVGFDGRDVSVGEGGLFDPFPLGFAVAVRTALDERIPDRLRSGGPGGPGVSFGCGFFRPLRLPGTCC